jgi:hypothetical protein
MTMRRRAEHDDQLMLLAHIAQGLGADLEDYEPPSERISGWLTDLAPQDPTRRRAEVLAVIDAAGGEAG